MANATVNFNSTLLGANDYGVTLLHGADWQPTVQKRIDVQSVPYGSGVSQGAFSEVLTIDVPVMVEGIVDVDMQTKIRNIGFVLNQSAEETPSDKPLFFPNTQIDDIQWQARFEGMTNAFETTPTSANFIWTFVVTQPVPESRTLTTQDVAPAGAPHAFNIPAAGVLAGNIKAFPVYTFTATGAVASITLVNVTQDVTLTYSGALINNDVLVIDTDPGVLSIQRTRAGVTTNQIGNMTALGFPTLNPRVVNSMTVLGANNTTLAITYRPRQTTG